MTDTTETRSGVQAWAQIHIGRPGYLMTFVGLCAGTVLHFAGSSAAGLGVLTAVFGLLIILPAVNVVAILVEEARSREWVFVVMALVVLGMLGYRALG
jgi:hypothetical protein